MVPRLHSSEVTRLSDPPETSSNVHRGPSTAQALRKLGPAGVIAVVSAILPPLGFAVLVGFINQIAPWLRSHGTQGVALYVVAFWFLGGFALLPTYAYAILGGWAFGFAWGLPAAICGFTGAAIVGYLVAGRVSGDRVVRLIGENPRWQAVYEALLKGSWGKTLLIVFLMRLLPNSPFATTNVILSATRTPLPLFILGTVLGITPRVSVVLFTAAQMSQLSFSLKENKLFVIGGITLTILILGIIGMIGRRAMRKVTSVPPTAAG
jgi:uncharacterized membrane protein YdjX (TVP38/TMEM64 family)